MEEIKCPKCGSDNVQSVKMIYMQGTTDKRSFSITNLGEYVTSTAGGSQTRLAQAVAAPSRKETHWTIVGILALITFIVFALFLLSFFDKKIDTGSGITEFFIFATITIWQGKNEL